MTDIRALAERIAKDDKETPAEVKTEVAASSPNVYKAMSERAELARALLRMLEAGEVLEKASIDDIHPHYDAHQALSEAIDAWRAAVRGEEECAMPDVFGFKRPFQPSEPEPYDTRYPPDGQGVV